MVIVGPDGCIQLINRRAEKLFGYSRAELVGQPIEILIPSRYRQVHPKHRYRYFAEPRARPMAAGVELHGLRKDGTEFPAEISLAPVETAQGLLVTAAGVELYGLRRDGSEFPVEISLSPLETEDGVLVSSTIRNVTDRKKAEELRFQLAAIVDSSDDAIVGKSLDGMIRSWNKGAERVFGYKAEEVIGRPISVLLPPGREADEPAIIERLKHGERVEPFETLRRRKDGQDIHVSVTISPIHDSRGNVVGASKVARDISDRKRADEALARAKEAADSASLELEAFSHSVAHDLRAPLRGIDGFSQALLEDYSDKLDDEERRFLARVRSSA
jgi:PAS domain S-box-containing protein